MAPQLKSILSMSNFKPILLKHGVFGSVVLASQLGSSAIARADVAVVEPAKNRTVVLQENDLLELQIRSSEVSPEMIRDWSSKAFLSLVPAISNPVKMSLALLKMRMIAEKNFDSADLAVLSPEMQEKVHAVFYGELENYSERIALLTQLIRNAENETLRDLAKSVFVSIVRGTSPESKLFNYLKERSIHEVESLVREDRQLSLLFGIRGIATDFARK